MNEAETVEAPGARYSCACVHFDACACLRARYGYMESTRREECGCVCHHDQQYEDDEL